MNLTQMKNHESNCIESLKLFLMLAVVFVWAYAIYEIISVPGGFGW